MITIDGLEDLNIYPQHAQFNKKELYDDLGFGINEYGFIDSISNFISSNVGETAKGEKTFLGVGAGDWMQAGTSVIGTIGGVSQAYMESKNLEKIGEQQQQNLSMQMGILKTQLGAQAQEMEKNLADREAQREHELNVLNAILTDKQMARDQAAEQYYTQHKDFVDDKTWERQLQLKQLQAQTAALQAGVGVPGITAAQFAPVQAGLFTSKNLAIGAGILLLVGGTVYFAKRKKQ